MTCTAVADLRQTAVSLNGGKDWTRRPARYEECYRKGFDPSQSSRGFGISSRQILSKNQRLEEWRVRSSRSRRMSSPRSSPSA